MKKTSSRRLVVIAFLLALIVLLYAGNTLLVRRMLFYPTHAQDSRGLARWEHDGRLLGFAREVEAPENVWLLLHGNGGQAADRGYALRAFSPRDAVFIMEYPGYGMREGKPSRRTIDAAAREAYGVLRARFGNTPVCVAAESIGSGPAATLGALAHPPDKLVFIVPFDSLKSLAKDYVRHVPVSLLLAGSWNNVDSLAKYKGPIDVFGARRDTVIPVKHAGKLAASRPQARFHLIEGGHNDWSSQEVRIRNP